MRARRAVAIACGIGYPVTLAIVASVADIVPPLSSFAAIALTGFVLGTVIPLPAASP